MIKTFFLYLGYALATIAVTGVSYLNLAPQFGSNPSKKEKLNTRSLQTLRMEFLLIPKVLLS